MKADEAIQILKTWKITGDKAHEALDMAIEALRNYPTSMSGTSDLISRQAAIDAMANALWHYPNEGYRNLNEYKFARGLAEFGLKSVPSVHPERKKGKWVSIPHQNDRECSVCGHTEPYKFADKDAEIFNYCPHCGSRMEEGCRWVI